MKKSVFVTGAHDGTGFAIAERFAKEGYDVFIGSREKEKADSAAAKLCEKYGVFAKGYVYQTVTLDEYEVKAIFDDIRANGYLLDTLVLNAANLGIGQVSLDVNINDFMGVYTTNIGWNFLMSREEGKGQGRDRIYRLKFLCESNRKQMCLLLFKKRYQRYVKVLCRRLGQIRYTLQLCSPGYDKDGTLGAEREQCKILSAELYANRGYCNL